MAFSKETLAAVKERADIVEVIGERVHLQASGSDYVGLCPFHGEKTPSFRVSPGYRTYHCFGCGAGGSVIDFVMGQERLSFPEAVRTLADRYGVPLPDDGPHEGVERSREVLLAAERYYHEILLRRPEGETARRYLRERAFEEPDWDAFGLGWALDDWQAFLRHGQAEGFGQADLLGSGLVRQSDSGRMYDMLRKRVAIPIRDERGRPIAFGGRVIDPLDHPKYLNTPETRHYHKSRVLFGLSQGLETLRNNKRAVLVEGYLDVMRLHQHGFREAVATCGTALTEEHLKLLARNAERVLLLFDGDEAGIKAALRSAPLFLNAALEARVVLLPDGQDPDDYLRAHPADAFAAELEDATPLLEFLVFQLAKQHGRSVHGRQQTLDAIAPILGQIRTEAARDLTVRYVADLVGVSPEALLSMVRPQKRDRDTQMSGPATSLGQREGRHQRRVLRLMLEHPELVGAARGLLQPDQLRDDDLRTLYARMLEAADDAAGHVPDDTEDKVADQAEAAETKRRVGPDPEALIEGHPQLAATVRALLMDEGLHGSAVSDPTRQLENEVLCVKEELKADLFRTFRSLVGTPEEELALRRYCKVRDELAAMKAEFRRTHATRPEVTLRPLSRQG